ncbi:hypothetical protein STEG23_002107, partial [Scotinomys teguina]
INMMVFWGLNNCISSGACKYEIYNNTFDSIFCNTENIKSIAMIITKPLSCLNTKMPTVGFQLDLSIHGAHSGLLAKEGIEPGMVYMSVNMYVYVCVCAFDVSQMYFDFSISVSECVNFCVSASHDSDHQTRWDRVQILHLLGQYSTTEMYFQLHDILVHTYYTP